MTEAYDRSLAESSRSLLPSELTLELKSYRDIFASLPISDARTLLMSVIWNIQEGKDPRVVRYQRTIRTPSGERECYCRLKPSDIKSAIESLASKAADQSLLRARTLERHGVTNWKDIPQRPISRDINWDTLKRGPSPSEEKGLMLMIRAESDVVLSPSPSSLQDASGAAGDGEKIVGKVWSKSAQSQADTSSANVKDAGLRVLDVLERWDEYVRIKKLMEGDEGAEGWESGVVWEDGSGDGLDDGESGFATEEYLEL